MYRNRKSNRGLEDDSENFKILLIVTGSVLLIAIVTFIVIYLIYNTKINESVDGILDSSELASLSNSTVSKSVSSEIGKTIEQVKNEANLINNSYANMYDFSNIINNTSLSSNMINSITNTVVETNTNISNEINTISSEDINIEVEKKDPVFDKPINGTIIREFAKDNLVFSNTLDEWIVHLGLDIQADKATVVKSAADGIVKSIKNDPRYGLTVVVKHENDFETVYSNLLTAEFVTEGEKLKMGQTLGTVGNNATFEIADEPHLHFELIKNGEKIDPKIYIKF